MKKRATPAGLRIREVRADADPAFRRAHALLVRIFPPAETVPLGTWKQVVRERHAGVWTDMNWHLFLAERRGRTVGAATGVYIGNVNVGLVGYVAVGKRARSSGVGPRLRWALRLAFDRDARRLIGRPLHAMAGEVRPDNPWLQHLVRHGAIALDLPYFQPSLRPRAKDVPLVLYYQPLGSPRRFVAVAEVRRLLYAIWRRVYRVPQPLSSPTFRRMLRSLDGRARIGQRLLDARRAEISAFVA